MTNQPTNRLVPYKNLLTQLLKNVIFLCNLKMYYRDRRSLPLDYILSRLRSIRLGLPEGISSSGFRIENLYAFLIAFTRAACPTRITLFTLISFLMFLFYVYPSV